MERTEIISLTYNITKEGVEKKLRGIEPQEGLAKYFVELEEKKYVIKQVISQILNFAKTAFTTEQVYVILYKLGFEIRETI